CFDVRGQELAFPIEDVRETLPIQPITRVVLTPRCLAGVFSLRGDIVPAIDLAVLLGLPPAEVADASRIVVIESPYGPAGIVSDRLRDLRPIEGGLEPAPANVATNVAPLLLGVAATETGSVRVLSAAAIVAAEPLRVLARDEQGRTT